MRAGMTMPQFTYDPPLSSTPGFVQTIRVNGEKQGAGTATWHAPAAGEDGIAQILVFTVPLHHRRAGHGKRLMAAVIGQVLDYHRLRKLPPRRIWMIVRQKQQVIARAFLISQGFVHTATIKELLLDEDALVYVKTFN